VDVSGLERTALLHALWLNAKTCNAYICQVLLDDTIPDTHEFPLERIMEVLRNPRGPCKFASGNYPYVDYVVGRAIKANVFSESPLIDATHYDEYWGAGAFRRVVEALRTANDV
jgi:hypothetical protein